MPTTSLFQKKLSRNDWIIILANLLPVYGVWFMGWSAVEVFIVYAMETLILGILTVFKLLMATLARGTDNWYSKGKQSSVSGLFFIVFFIMHYGIFTLVQTSIFAGVSGITPSGKSPEYFFFHFWEFINQDIGIMLLIFILSYLLRDLLPFLIRKDYLHAPMLMLMFQPYGRIIIQQFTVILGSMFLTFKLGAIFVLVFALVKIIAEIYFPLNNLYARAMESSEKDQDNNSSHS
ncbi:MAG: hypothetical protein KAX45_06625 [Chitinophagaceae bacterium]|nr:hypothetical protein [Chitinophagaceae bacterium]MBP8244193.1 hypothetical protein [Chitinophagaceae bacterium]